MVIPIQVTKPIELLIRPLSAPTLSAARKLRVRRAVTNPASTSNAIPLLRNQYHQGSAKKLGWSPRRCSNTGVLNRFPAINKPVPVTQ